MCYVQLLIGLNFDAMPLMKLMNLQLLNFKERTNRVHTHKNSETH